MLTLRQMRSFEALAVTGHFGRAAAAVHISQPALSAQIRDMEAWLGARLVERLRPQAVLTQKGEAVLAHIRRVLAEVDALERTARRGDGPLEGPVRIGIIPTVAPYLVPRLVPFLRDAYPSILIELKEAMTERLIADLQEGRLDAVIAALPVTGEGLDLRPLLLDRFFMAVARNDKEVLVSPMTETEVDPERLLLLEEGHCLRDQALAVCGTAGRRSFVNVGATSMATLLQMVSHDMGMTLIPEMAIRTETARNDITILPFAEPAPAREIGLIWRRAGERSEDMEALCEAVRASVPRLEA